MSRLTAAWHALTPEQRLAALAAVGLLVTMFLPWYGLQGLNRKTGVIDSHTISAFGDVSFVEAAIFLVAAGVLAMLFARGDARDFQLPGGDGTIVVIAGCWAAALIFFRVFSRPPGGGEPVGIEWGFFLAFVAAGALAFAGLRMRARERPQAPSRRATRAHPRGSQTPLEPLPARSVEAVGAPRSEPAISRSPARVTSPSSAPGAAPAAEPQARPDPPPGEDATTVIKPAAPRPRGSAPASTRERTRYPPAPPEQLSFEDPATHAE
jgi:hypothetical protein